MTTGAACIAVLTTFEVLENNLTQLPLHSLGAAILVSQTWRTVIMTSTRLPDTTVRRPIAHDPTYHLDATDVLYTNAAANGTHFHPGLPQCFSFVVPNRDLQNPEMEGQKNVASGLFHFFFAFDKPERYKWRFKSSGRIYAYRFVSELSDTSLTASTTSTAASYFDSERGDDENDPLTSILATNPCDFAMVPPLESMRFERRKSECGKPSKTVILRAKGAIRMWHIAYIFGKLRGKGRRRNKGKGRGKRYIQADYSTQVGAPSGWGAE